MDPVPSSKNLPLDNVKSASKSGKREKQFKCNQRKFVSAPMTSLKAHMMKHSQWGKAVQMQPV